MTEAEYEKRWRLACEVARWGNRVQRGCEVGEGREEIEDLLQSLEESVMEFREEEGEACLQQLWERYDRLAGKYDYVQRPEQFVKLDRLREAYLQQLRWEKEFVREAIELEVRNEVLQEEALEEWYEQEG